MSALAIVAYVVGFLATGALVARTEGPPDAGAMGVLWALAWPLTLPLYLLMKLFDWISNK